MANYNPNPIPYAEVDECCESYCEYDFTGPNDHWRITNRSDVVFTTYGSDLESLDIYAGIQDRETLSRVKWPSYE